MEDIARIRVRAAAAAAGGDGEALMSAEEERELLVREVEHEDRAERGDEEDDVEPAVVEVELQLFAEHAGHHIAVLLGHRHAHQQHQTHQVHALRKQIRHLQINLMRRNVDLMRGSVERECECEEEEGAGRGEARRTP